MSREPKAREVSGDYFEELARFPEENPNPVMRISADYQLVYANSASAPALQGMKIGVGDVVPDDLKFAAEDAWASGDPQTLVVSWDDVLYSLTLHPIRGRDYLNVFGRDVTRQRQIEERIEHLARFPDENPNPIMRINEDLVLLYANEPARPILSAWKMQIGATIPEDLRPKIHSGFRAERTCYVEVSFGAHIYALQIAPVPQAGYANIYGRDVTRLKVAERELIQANEDLALKNRELERKNAELQRANRLKDEFLANTSHELRTPLNGIVGLSESLLDGASGTLPEAMRADVSMIVASGRRLTRLVNDILDFSQLQHRDIDLSLRAVDLRTAVELVLILSRPLVAKKRLELNNAVPEGLPFALADEDRLQQILHNLVGNAVKFTNEGEVTVTAELVRGEGGEQVLEVAVKDTGIGMSSDVLPTIFHAFEQGDGATAREYGGTGLGLSVTKALVELHGGRLRVVSEEGVGSVFTFSIPKATEAQRASLGEGRVEATETLQRLNDVHRTRDELSVEETERQTDSAALATASGEPVQVLVVDDDPVNLRVLSNHLSPRGYVVHTAESGHEALALVDQGVEPDIVLLDVMMPRMSGYEVCRALRKTFPANELPVVLVTARTQVTDLVEGLDSGANDYLSKPISKTELLARLRTHLVNARMSTAAGRFVPREFLSILGHRDLVDVSRGDHMEKEMSIYFSDIRAFTTIVEGKTPAENFQFINEYLSYMEPPIRRSKGFIDSYEGDAIMALFDQTADDAVRAGIGSLEALKELNTVRQAKGEPPIRVGIGINTGRLMLGTIGGRERIKCGVIGDPVNLAARIEGMTKRYGASLVISEYTRAKLEDVTAYECRPLDRVIVKGKTEPVTLYEVLDGLPTAERDAKLAGRDAFVEAWRLFQAGEVHGALAGFQAGMNSEAPDPLLTLYAARCRELLDTGVPKGWDGVIRMTTK